MVQWFDGIGGSSTGHLGYVELEFCSLLPEVEDGADMRARIGSDTRQHELKPGLVGSSVGLVQPSHNCLGPSQVRV